MEAQVLEKYRGRGFGSELIDYVKEQNMPIKAVSRQNAWSFFEDHDFETLKYDIERDLADNALIWYRNIFCSNKKMSLSSSFSYSPSSPL